MSFTHAIVRPPGPNFAEGLTTAGLGPPDYAKALAQHAAYGAALEAAGLRLTRLPPDPTLPDSTFVEDAAIVTARGALVTHPGAPSRRDEVLAVAGALREFFPTLTFMTPPGTLDGGDICQAGRHFFIGVSARTNEGGARQLTWWLKQNKYTSTVVDIRTAPGMLHLKSGLAWLGGRRLLAAEALAGHPAFRGYEILAVTESDTYAANSLLVNGTLLVPAGFPGLEKRLQAFLQDTRGPAARIQALEMSEFRKQDGGLSCLSLRW